MDHQQAQDMFSDYLDGTLAERVRAEVEQHLAVCIQCRTELESLRRAVGSLGQAEAGGAAELPARHQAADLPALARAVLRPALEAVRAHPVRVGLAGDDHRDAGLLHRDAARLARAACARRRERSASRGRSAWQLAAVREHASAGSKGPFEGPQ